MNTFSIWGFGVKREKLQATCGLSALVREKLQGGQAPSLKKRLDYLGPVKGAHVSENICPGQCCTVRQVQIETKLWWLEDREFHPSKKSGLK